MPPKCGWVKAKSLSEKHSLSLLQSNSFPQELQLLIFIIIVSLYTDIPYNTSPRNSYHRGLGF